MREMLCSCKPKVWVLTAATSRSVTSAAARQRKCSPRCTRTASSARTAARRSSGTSRSEGMRRVARTRRARAAAPWTAAATRHAPVQARSLDDHEDMVSSVAHLQSRAVSTVTLWLQKSVPFHVFVQVGTKSVLLLLNSGGGDGVPTTGWCLLPIPGLPRASRRGE